MRHWHYETDIDNIAWLTFDKAGESVNTFSAEAMQELGAAIDAISATRPHGLIIRSGKRSGFIAGADIEEFTQLKTTEAAQELARRGWDLYNRIAALPYRRCADQRFCMGGALSWRWHAVIALSSMTQKQNWRCRK